MGYQYYIDRWGKVWQARADDEEGAHCKGRNNDSIGICLEGSFDETRPSQSQINAVKDLILRKMTQWAIPPNNVYGHRIYASYKSCPGLLWPESEIKKLFQPDMNYYQKLLNSLRDWLNSVKIKGLGSSASSCINKNSRG